MKDSQNQQRRRKLEDQSEEEMNDSIESIISEVKSKSDPTSKDLANLMIECLTRVQVTNTKIAGIGADIELLDNKIEKCDKKVKDIASKSAKNEERLNKLEQQQIDNDIIVGVFPVKPNAKKITEKLQELYGFQANEVVSSYSFLRKLNNSTRVKATSTPSTSQKSSESPGYYVVISFRDYVKKQEVMSKKKGNQGPLIFEQLVDESIKPTAEQLKMEIKISNRLTFFNLYAQRILYTHKERHGWEKIQLHNGWFRTQKKGETVWKYFKTESEIHAIIPNYEFNPRASKSTK